MKYKVIHIHPTDEEIVKGEKRNDWNYELFAEKLGGERIGKLFRSRAAASRFANKHAKKVSHWYMF